MWQIVSRCKELYDLIFCFVLLNCALDYFLHYMYCTFILLFICTLGVTVVCFIMMWTGRNSLMLSVYVYTIGLDVRNDILQFTVFLFYNRLDGQPFVVQVIRDMYMWLKYYLTMEVISILLLR